jgi:hypothetical protein
MRVLFGEFAARILASCQATAPAGSAMLANGAAVAGGAAPGKPSMVRCGEPFFGLSTSAVDSTPRLLRFRAPSAWLAIGEE